jgi:hypothetical protein
MMLVQIHYIIIYDTKNTFSFSNHIEKQIDAGFFVIIIVKTDIYSWKHVNALKTHSRSMPFLNVSELSIDLVKQ